MSLYLGIDVGTTKTAAVVLDIETGLPVAVHSAPNANQLPTPAERSEWDASAGVDLALNVARRAVEAASPHGSIAGVGVTGQMHGVVVVDESLRPLTPLIGWQDKRCDLPAGGFPSTIAWMQQLAGPDLLARTGCRLATGYLGPTMFWLIHHGGLPVGSATACFMPDLVVARLCEQRPMSDPTNAASAGVFSAVEWRWEDDLLRALDLPAALFPEVLPTGALAGRLAPAVASALGLPAGVPVMNAMGDNQASFVGSVADLASDLLINIGTGGQISATADRFVLPDVLESRPFVGGSYLLVGAGITGGSSYALLRDFIRRVGQDVFGLDASADLYPALNRLAASVPAGSDGLRCDPRFAGTRHDPSQRGSYEGISAATFTPGHLARALLEGVASTFWDTYEEMLSAGLRPRTRLIGSGNGIRRNPLLAEILADRFGMALVTPLHSEEAATGVALLTAVATGELTDLASAGRLIHYRSTGED